MYNKELILFLDCWQLRWRLLFSKNKNP